MIVRLVGTVLDVFEDCVFVDRDGVCREVLVPQFAIPELAAHRGKTVTLHTLQMLEGNVNSGSLAPRIVGFLHPEEKRFFLRFVDVKGIGMRKALKALTEPVRRVASWIESGDAKSLATLPGIGNRAAELVIATLKGKLGEWSLGEQARGGATVEFSGAQRDALEVLVAWGDARADAQRWLERAAQLYPDVNAPDEWVRVAYRVKAGAEG